MVHALTLSQPGAGRLGPPYSIGPSLAQTRRGGPGHKMAKTHYWSEICHTTYFLPA